MKISAIFFFLVIILNAEARSQYYYRDILTPMQVANERVAYESEKVRSILLNSFEGDGNESPGFYAEKRVSKDFRTTDLFTRTQINGPSQFISTFDKAGKLISTYDTTRIAVSSTAFNYNADGKVVSTKTRMVSSDEDFVNEIIEEHIYTYNQKGIPERMLLVKNGRDTSIILFASDEEGRVAIEKDTRTGSKYYYYYNEKGLLTQIVLENALRSNPYPSYVFTYNNAGKLSQMITTEEGGNKIDYTIWRYTYDGDLKATEKIYSKERKLLGSVEYLYRKK